MNELERVVTLSEPTDAGCRIRVFDNSGERVFLKSVETALDTSVEGEFVMLIQTSFDGDYSPTDLKLFTVYMNEQIV